MTGVMLYSAVAPSLVFGEELEHPYSICQVMSNYGVQAAQEKIANKESSLNESYTILVYGLSKEDSFKSLDVAAKETFLNTVYDTFTYVYGDESISLDNAQSKSLEHCLGRTNIAWQKIIPNLEFCQLRGRLYESSTMLRDKGQPKAVTLSYFDSNARNGDDKHYLNAIKDAVDFAYSNSNTPEANGSLAYADCMKSATR